METKTRKITHEEYEMHAQNSFDEILKLIAIYGRKHFGSISIEDATAFSVNTLMSGTISLMIKSFGKEATIHLMEMLIKDMTSAKEIEE